LWRHGQTAFNAERRFQGQTDIPLNDHGREQAAQAARYLAALEPDAIFSSDLSRAAQTAAALARLTGLSVKLDEDLRERHGGSWEGLTDTEIREQYPEAFAAWVPPDGEPVTAVGDRSSAALERIADAMPGGSVAVVVGHGASLGMGVARLLGIPDGARVLGPFGNCRWSVASRRLGKWRLLEHNVGWLPEPVAEAAAELDADGSIEAELEPAGVPDAERED
jgi:glucosyl-3-phosphoglycerate phosphatase